MKKAIIDAVIERKDAEVLSLRTRLDAEHAAHLAEIAAHKETRGRAEEALEVLRSVEWGARTGFAGEHPTCPSCHWSQRYDPDSPEKSRKHAPGCALAALLEKKGEERS